MNTTDQERYQELKETIIREVKNFLHLCLAILANIYYRFPSRSLVVIGVTGTDGKTTTTTFLHHALKTFGYKTAMITTVGAFIGDQVYDVGFHVTTPSPFLIQRYLRQAVREGNTHVVLEITSHALDQHRAWGIHFACGILTNISHEHLDYHKTYERYVEAKVSLLLKSDTAIINKNDPSYEAVIPYLLAKKYVIYAIWDPHADYNWQDLNLKTTLLGKFNKLNLTAAYTALAVLRIDTSRMQQAIDTFRLPPGRQEVVREKDPKIMIDFAHTPKAFFQLLPELKLTTPGRVIHVFGSAGERDATKRPLMGRYASMFTDIIILTSEDPRSEKPEVICKKIRSGFVKKWKNVPEEYVPKVKERKRVYTILDRAKAIEKALAIAQDNDSIVCTGKGHETSMNYGKGEVPWNEKELILSLLKNKRHKTIKTGELTR